MASLGGGGGGGGGRGAGVPTVWNNIHHNGARCMGKSRSSAKGKGWGGVSGSIDTPTKMLYMHIILDCMPTIEH